jgi:signal transduction histidine kinase
MFLSNQPDKALYYQDKAFGIAVQLDALPELAECYNNYCVIYEQSGQFQKALEYHRKYKETDDCLQSEKVLQNMLLTEEKFQVEFKQNELELQKKDNEILKLKLGKSTWLKNFMFGILISVIAFLILFIFHYRSKLKTNTFLSKLNAELSETNQKLINSEVKLRELNATKDKFFSIISHDLRNPFASLVSFVRIMQRDYDTMKDSEIKELVSDMKTTVEKAQDLLENLLVWSKTQTGKVIFHPEDFNLFEAVQENVYLYQSTLNQKQIAVQLFIENPTPVYGDFNMMKTIIRNLLSNAIKFTSPKGNIIISYEKNHQYHILRIKDNGMGLKEESIPLLFVPGGQKSRYGTANEKGSGIGLLICKEFIDRHNGFIHVESNVDKGSTFSIHFPIREINPY